MQTWVFRASASRLDDQPREFNVLAKGVDMDAAISRAIAEMDARGWLDIDVLRCVELDADARTAAKGYLRNAIDDVETFGFSFIRYGPSDN